MGLGTFLSGFIFLLREIVGASGSTTWKSGCLRLTGPSSRGDRLVSGNSSSSGVVRMFKDGTCDSLQRQKVEGNKDNDPDDDVGVRSGRILALRSARVIRRGWGETRTDCGGCFVGSDTSKLLTASGSSLRLCRGDVKDVAGPNRLPRHEGGKNSSWYSEWGSVSLSRLIVGRFVPASVRWRSLRQSESGKFSVVVRSSGGNGD